MRAVPKGCYVPFSLIQKNKSSYCVSGTILGIKQTDCSPERLQQEGTHNLAFSYIRVWAEAA